MFANPFSPVFGGKPNLFFGRQAILDRFDKALINQGSEDRALFITGSRGYGKTALLEQLSIRAQAAGRKTVDVGPDNLIWNLVRHIIPFDELTKTIDPQVGVNVLGTGGTIHGGSHSRTVRYHDDDFPFLFLRECEHSNPKLFISIDEVQKIPLDDLSIVCNTFQMASRKGFDVMLAVAGLPYAYDRVIQHDGCTYLRRGEHEELGPFSPEEVHSAFEQAFSGIEGLTIDGDALEKLVDTSKGHPYLMQLEGYHVVEAVNDENTGRRYHITKATVERVIPQILSAYGRHATRPLLEAMSSADIAYLRAMSQTMGKDRIARTSDIAAELGKKLSQISRTRERLISNGIVYAPRQGELVFAIPYLADYILEHESFGHSGLEAVVRWRM